MNGERRVLLTAFEPFGGDTTNASMIAVDAVRPERVDASLRRVVLPCVFGAAIDALRDEVERFAPHVVVCTGQAAGRSAVSLERVAINLDDARIPDNAGAQPIDEAIVAGGPAAYWSSLPIKRIASRVQGEAIAVEISQSAGTFVCNHVFYGLMHMLASRPECRGGFVHLPLVASAQQNMPALPAPSLGRALELVAATALEGGEDARLPGGAIS